MSLSQVSLQFTDNNLELVEKVQTKHNTWNPGEALSLHSAHFAFFFFVLLKESLKAFNCV